MNYSLSFSRFSEDFHHFLLFFGAGADLGEGPGDWGGFRAPSLGDLKALSTQRLGCSAALKSYLLGNSESYLFGRKVIFGEILEIIFLG